EGWNRSYARIVRQGSNVKPLKRALTSINEFQLYVSRRCGIRSARGVRWRGRAMSLAYAPEPQRAYAPRQAHVIVVGNQKGGAGKSTVAMHIIVALMRMGRRTGALD